jgi:hypothetical protein
MRLHHNAKRPEGGSISAIAPQGREQEQAPAELAIDGGRSPRRERHRYKVKRPEAGAFREGYFGGNRLEGFVCGSPQWGLV